jgi:DNA-binding GntR family transcriptional regulator
VTSSGSRKTASATAADFAFHRAIVAAAGHSRLTEQYRRVAQQISIVIASSNALLSDPVQLVHQHEPLYRAILAGKADAAATLARRHIETEGAKLIAHLNAASTKPETAKPKRKVATS